MLEDLYAAVLQKDSDIKPHFALLHKYALFCDSIVELGFRGGVSATVLAATKPKRMQIVDWDRPPFEIDRPYLYKLQQAAADEDVQINFAACDSLDFTPPRCDLLFIDTFHTYDHLMYELIRYATFVKRYILIHDTEEPTCPGMFPAVEDYLLDNPQWELERRERTRPGLTVLKRISDARPYKYGRAFMRSLDFEVRWEKKLYYQSVAQGGSANDEWYRYMEQMKDYYKDANRWPLSNSRESATALAACFEEKPTPRKES
jgi:hypothetical protein